MNILESPLWQNPNIESLFSGVFTVFLIPFFYFAVWQSRFDRKRWIQLSALAGITAFLFFAKQWFHYHAAPSGIDIPASSKENLFASAYVLCKTLALWVWPFGQQSIAYPYNPALLEKSSLLYWLIIVLLLRNCFRLRKRNPYLWYGMLWALLMLLPYCGLLPYAGPAISETQLYFSGLGLAIAVASLIRQTGIAWTSRIKAWSRKIVFITLNLALICWCLAVCGYHTMRIINSPTWEARIQKSLTLDSQNFVASAELARLEASRGNDAVAQRIILHTSQQAPLYSENAIIKAEISIRKGDLQTAQHHLEEAAQIAPNNARIQQLLSALRLHLQVTENK